MSGGVYNEMCYCPLPSLSEWLFAMKCPVGYEQITRDLSQFGKIDMGRVAAEAMDRFSSHGAHSLCHYVIKDNKVCRQLHFMNSCLGFFVMIFKSLSEIIISTKCEWSEHWRRL